VFVFDKVGGGEGIWTPVRR